VDISNSFELPMDPDSAWNTLLNIKRVMPCIPGAELLEESSDGSSYRGKVSVKLGPVALAFVGTAMFTERDETARRAHLKAKGSDSKGRGGVSADMTFHVTASGGGSRVSVLTQVQFTGAVAQYGRGTGIIQGVASQLIGEFAANLRASLASQGGAAGSLPDAQPQTASADSAKLARAAERNTADVPEQLASAKAPSGEVRSPRPISGFSLLWKVLWNWLIGPFRRRA